MASNEPAAPHEPPYKYNDGYALSEQPPPEIALQSDPAQALVAEDDDYDDELDMDDIFDNDMDDQGPAADSGDLAKSYNRQRQAHESGAGAAMPRGNRQKPAVNTFASVDDQVAALSRHAAKIRLDDVKEGSGRDKDKADRATSDQVMDQRTRMILLQLINRDQISEVYGAISTGKEANVYNAILLNNGVTEQLAVKIYKTAILSFKDRERYMTGEHRFQKGVDKGNSRKMVQMWAEKEFRNLNRIHAAGIPSPKPMWLKLHVLVMSLLGDRRGRAYPRLLNVVLNGDKADEQWAELYLQLVGVMRRLYQVCKLVHADLSEYNLLYNDGTLYIIDVSQSVEHDHPRALEFLRMDIKNVGDFFRRKGVETLGDRVVFNFITTPKGPTEGLALSDATKDLYSLRTTADDSDQALAQLEVDNEVFRNQYIPQTLEQVYDIEKEGAKLDQGGGEDLIYRNLLADSVVKKDDKSDEEAEGSSDDESSDSGVDLEDGSADGSSTEKKRPRGRKFEDKDEKKVGGTMDRVSR